VNQRTITTTAPARARLLALLAVLLLAAPAPAQTDDTLRAGMRDMIASARDAVFPALVHVEVQTVDKQGGQEIRGMATGSGTIIDPTGLVLTNAHVTDGGRKFTCTLANKRRVDATLVGEDPWTDLALLRLDEPGPYPSAAFGESSDLQTGDLVLAMGSPFALDRSVTLGIVSNPQRVFVGGPEGEVEQMYLGWGYQRTGLFTTWIQHDALINPGNSGGPLVDMHGRVVGVNTRGGAGNGFATPASIAREVVEQLRDDGAVDRSWVGIGFKHLERTGYDPGVFVDWVDSDGPAYAAGVRAGDLVTSVNGLPVTVSFPEQIPPLLRLVASLPVGSQLTLGYERDGQAAEAALTTEQLRLDVADMVSLRHWGLTVSDITPYEAQLLLLTTSDGAYVESTRGGMPAELAEPPLQRGDIIRAVNDRPVENIRDIVAAYSDIDERDDAPEYVIIAFDRQGSQLVTALHTVLPDPADPPRDLPKSWLGIDTQPIVPELARHLEGEIGFRVTRVYPGTTAADSGLAVGDIITAVGDLPTRPAAIEQSGLFGRAIRRLPIGAEVTVHALRGGAAVEIPVTLERGRTRPEEAKRARNRDFGLVVRAVTFFDRIDRRLDDDTRGVIVDSVEDGGWASAGGLSYGDLLVGIDDDQIRSTASFTEVMERLAEEQPERVIFKVRRGNRTSFKFVEPEWTPQLEDQTDPDKADPNRADPNQADPDKAEDKADDDEPGP
jgi:serine protease Do